MGLNGSIPLIDTLAVHPHYRNSVAGCAWADRHRPLITGPFYDEGGGWVHWVILMPGVAEPDRVSYHDDGWILPDYRWWCLHCTGGDCPHVAAVRAHSGDRMARSIRGRKLYRKYDTTRCGPYGSSLPEVCRSFEEVIRRVNAMRESLREGR